MPSSFDTAEHRELNVIFKKAASKLSVDGGGGGGGQARSERGFGLWGQPSNYRGQARSGWGQARSGSGFGLWGQSSNYNRTSPEGKKPPPLKQTDSSTANRWLGVTIANFRARFGRIRGISRAAGGATPAIRGLRLAQQAVSMELINQVVKATPDLVQKSIQGAVIGKIIAGASAVGGPVGIAVGAAAGGAYGILKIKQRQYSGQREAYRLAAGEAGLIDEKDLKRLKRQGMKEKESVDPNSFHGFHSSGQLTPYQLARIGQGMNWMLKYPLALGGMVEGLPWDEAIARETRDWREEYLWDPTEERKTELKDLRNREAVNFTLWQITPPLYGG